MIMANHSSTKKSIRKIAVRTVRRKSRMSDIKTFIKKVEQAVSNNQVELAKDIFKRAQSKIDSGVTKKLLKANTAARKVKNLSAKIKSLNA